MNFAIAGNSLLNDGEVIANFVPANPRTVFC